LNGKRAEGAQATSRGKAGQEIGVGEEAEVESDQVRRGGMWGRKTGRNREKARKKAGSTVRAVSDGVNGPSERRKAEEDLHDISPPLATRLLMVRTPGPRAGPGLSVARRVWRQPDLAHV